MIISITRAVARGQEFDKLICIMYQSIIRARANIVMHYPPGAAHVQVESFVHDPATLSLLQRNDLARIS